MEADFASASAVRLRELGASLGHEAPRSTPPALAATLRTSQSLPPGPAGGGLSSKATAASRPLLLRAALAAALAPAAAATAASPVPWLMGSMQPPQPPGTAGGSGVRLTPAAFPSGCRVTGARAACVPPPQGVRLVPRIVLPRIVLSWGMGMASVPQDENAMSVAVQNAIESSSWDSISLCKLQELKKHLQYAMDSETLEPQPVFTATWDDGKECKNDCLLRGLSKCLCHCKVCIAKHISMCRCEEIASGRWVEGRPSTHQASIATRHTDGPGDGGAEEATEPQTREEPQRSVAEATATGVTALANPVGEEAKATEQASDAAAVALASGALDAVASGDTGNDKDAPVASGTSGEGETSPRCTGAAAGAEATEAGAEVVKDAAGEPGIGRGSDGADGDEATAVGEASVPAPVESIAPAEDEADGISSRSVLLTPAWRDGALAASELLFKRRLECARPGEELQLTLRQILYSQESIKGTFRDGRTIGQMRRELAMGTKAVTDIPRIHAVMHEGRVYSADNRRLWAFKHSGMPHDSRINVVASWESDLFYRKLTTPTHGRTVRRRGEDTGYV